MQFLNSIIWLYAVLDSDHVRRRPAAELIASFYRCCVVVSIDEPVLLNAPRLLTEDTHHGLVVENTLTIVNSFS
jgi:predicted nucleic acid-binding protein